MASSDHVVNLEGKNCCYWVKHADGCSQAAHAGTVIVAALAAIVLVGAVLMILAQKGFYLGGINALARTIPAPYVQSAVVVAGTILLLDIFTLLTLVRTYTGLVYSREELEESGVMANINEVVINVDSMHYFLYVAPQKDETPGVYAIFTSDEAGNTSLIPFKHENGLRNHVARLEKEGYTPQAEESMGANEIYEVGQVQPLVTPGLLDKTRARLARDLPKNFYNWDSVFIKQWGCECLLFAGKNDQGEIRYFITRNSTKPDELATKYLPGLYNLRAVYEVMKKECSKTTFELAFHTYTYSQTDTEFLHKTLVKGDVQVSQIPLFLLTYRGYGITVHNEFFLSRDERTDLMRELHLI